MIDTGDRGEPNLARSTRRQASSAIIEHAREGWSEFVEGLRNWRIWHLIGSAEIRSRYARSRFGQAWLVTSTAVTVASLGWLWATLWRVPWQDMIVYVGVSLIMWQFLTGVLNDCASAFVANSHYFTNQHISPSTIVWAVVYRHGLIFAHNTLIIVALLVLFGGPPGVRVLLFIPGALLVILFGYWSGYVLAAMCARFRDVTQIVSLLVQFGFFFTPIFWRPEQAPPEVRILLFFNPFHLLLDILRSPLLGAASNEWTWILVAVLSLGGFFGSLPVIGRLRRQIILWI